MIRTDHNCKECEHGYDDEFLPVPKDEAAVKLWYGDEYECTR